jgi:hypothetical protein
MGTCDNPQYGYAGGGYGDPEYLDIVVGHEQVPCTVCNGAGWTEREKQPIVEQSIVGWRDPA